MPDFTSARQRMTEAQIARRGVRNTRVLQAMREIPREAFVPSQMAEFAYEDSPLSIEAGQTISQPYVVALMLEAADLGPKDRALEVGAGSGYAAAVMSRLCRKVFTIERIPELAELAKGRLQRLGYHNVDVRIGDGTKGWIEEAPFDVIVSAAAGPRVPITLRDQLAIGGRLIMPVGEETRRQRLIKLVRRSCEALDEEDLGEVLFVPLIGEYGWMLL